VICIGGLLDSNLPIRFQEWVGGKTPFTGSGLIADIAPQHRLSISNPTFRGNTLIPEGSASSTAIIAQQNGVLIQDLPFTIQLKRFVIDYYSTGMPKLFASDVVLRDHKTGETVTATIKVNQPLVYDGIALYQSSFEDGGSLLKLAAYPMRGTGSQSYSLAGKVNESTPLAKDSDYTVEWSGFRAFNVENIARAGGAGGSNGGAQDVRGVNKALNGKLVDSLEKHIGSGAKSANSKDLKNVGPSVQYKLRDKTGQAREYLNYMQPIKMDGDDVFLAGMRDTPSDQFRYLRIPADDEDSVNEWMRLRAALADPLLREAAAQRYAQRAMRDSHDTRDGLDTLRQQLQQSARKGLDLFAGDGKESGYLAVSRFLEKIPAAEQERAADIFIKILHGSLWDLWQIAREKAGLKALAPSEAHARFVQVASNALSDAAFYGAPVYLQLRDFQEIKASVLQLTRSPGKKVVYLGCLLLVLGVFSMLYIRERRVWVWIRPDGSGNAHVLMAMSSQRKTLDFEREFESLKAKLTQSA
jgi:cytochrome c biogenesis protein